MKLQGRGLYNLLRLNSRLDPSLKVQPWQIADYRKFSLDDLFSLLKKQGISLDESSFKLYAENTTSPEELTEYLYEDDNPEEEGKIFLLLFELWRRLLSGQPCISIFCDELDDLIELYDQKNLAGLNRLIDHLFALEDILDTHVDQGSSLSEVFSLINEYCAHNIENFLYDFIYDLIESKDFLIASELLDGFYEYVKDRYWFDLLKAELMFDADPEEASLMIRRLLETQKESPDLPFYFEVLYVASKYADALLFSEIFKEVFLLIEIEEELQELLEILLEFLRFQDKDEHCERLEELLKFRTQLDRSIKIHDKTLLKKDLDLLLQNL